MHNVHFANGARIRIYIYGKREYGAIEFFRERTKIQFHHDAK